MEPKKVSRVASRRAFLATTATAFGGLVLAACGGASGGTAGGGSGQGSGGAALKWSSWGNPGEAQRFVDYTKDWNTKNPTVPAEFILIPNDGYEAKMLTQLNGGTAPDVFYAGDGTIGKLIANKTIVDLTDLLNGPDSKSKPDEFADGLWGAAKTKEGKIFGVTVDCNPMVMWYNKKVLQDAGITELPAALYEKGQWNRQAFQGMLDQLHAKNKYGFILENWWGALLWLGDNQRREGLRQREVRRP